ncbi:hypothetical protein LCGC14_3116030, partial [marine sediment metagenome]
MVVHAFDVEIATEYGLAAGVLYNHFQHWISKNLTSGINYHEGHTWTYNTVRTFANQFPYLSLWEVREGLKNLIDAGIIIKGNYNKRKNDRTCWYCFGDEKTTLKGMPTHLWEAHKSSERRKSICGTHKSICGGRTALPIPITNSIPSDNQKTIGDKKSSSEILALDLKIAEGKKFFNEQLSAIFKFFTSGEKKTFFRITNHLVEQVQA